jgi:hypothetical protein
MPGAVSHLLKKKRDGLKSAKKRWRDDFATVKRQRDGFEAYRKETGCHPAPLKAVVLSDSYRFEIWLLTSCLQGIRCCGNRSVMSITQIPEEEPAQNLASHVLRFGFQTVILYAVLISSCVRHLNIFYF